MRKDETCFGKMEKAGKVLRKRMRKDEIAEPKIRDEKG